MEYKEPLIIKEIATLLTHPIPRASEDLEIHIIELDAVRFNLAQEIVDHMKLLHEKRKQMLWPKDVDKSLTELDRTVRLNADIAPIERNFEFLKRIDLLIEQRTGIMMELLN